MTFAILILVIIGLVALFKVGGKAGRRLKMLWVTGMVLMLGGCTGILALIGAETSGIRNFSSAYPVLWVGLAGLGLIVLLAASIVAITTRTKQLQQKEPGDGNT